MKKLISVTIDTDIPKQTFKLKKETGSDSVAMFMLEDAKKYKTTIFKLDRNIKPKSKIPEFKFL